MANGNGTALDGHNNGAKVNKAAVIGANTLMPVGAAVAVFIAAWQVQHYLGKRFDIMQNQLNLLREEYTANTYTVNNQLDGIRATMVNRWTSQDMKIWEQELKIKNPNINVPNSTEITRNRSVNTGSSSSR